MTSTTGGLPRAAAPLVVRTVEVADQDELLRLLPVPSATPELLAWVRGGGGLVGWGVAAELRTSGPDRFAEASAWWGACTASAFVRDRVGLPGTGLVAFGSFAFADGPGDSVLTVPEVVVGRRGGRTWVTSIGVSSDGVSPIGTRTRLQRSTPPEPPVGVEVSDGALTPDQWCAAVAEAVRRIDAGRLEKAVLARDLVARASGGIDVRWALERLAADYPTCWTFSVDGLFGATPEMLIRRERGLLTSRVLAGTIRRTGDDAADLSLAAALARSSKDLEEHE